MLPCGRVLLLLCLPPAATGEIGEDSWTESAEVVARAFGHHSASAPLPEPQPLKLIGASLSRTGTTSLTVALQQLGYRPYHGGHMFKEGHQALWATLARAESRGDRWAAASATDAVFTALAYSGFNATLDCLMCALYAESLAQYPEAKVLLTVRDSADTWAESVLSTAFKFPVVWRAFPFSLLASFRDMVETSRWLWVTRLGLPADEYFPDGHPETGELTTRAAAARVYESYVAAVVAHVPADRLLVYNVKSGWAPLCAFLHVTDCPDGPFPRVNDRTAAKVMLGVFQALRYAWPLALAAPVAAVVALRRCFWRAAKEKGS